MFVYDFIIVPNLKKKTEVAVWFGDEIYTSIVQCYDLVELNNASFQKLFLWKQQFKFQGKLEIVDQ